MIRAFLFDVDGTLVDSNDLHAAAWREAFLHFGIDIPFDRVRSQIGKGGDNLIPALLPPELVARKQKEIEDYRSALFRRDYLPKARPFPGVRPLFELIVGRGARIVLATSAKKAELDHHIELLGCADLIAAATSKDDVEHSKPDPDIVAAALAKVAPIGAAEAMVVGDTPYDAQAAGKLGIATIGFRSGGFPEQQLRAAGVRCLFDGPEDMCRRYEEVEEVCGGGARHAGGLP
ncbi:MAG: family hydrolase [Alphaproteobacteria bacterium]|nr:family hydrolase [Alphaproteobacteria bacterium]